MAERRRGIQRFAITVVLFVPLRRMRAVLRYRSAEPCGGRSANFAQDALFSASVSARCSDTTSPQRHAPFPASLVARIETPRADTRCARRDPPPGGRHSLCPLPLVGRRRNSGIFRTRLSRRRSRKKKRAAPKRRSMGVTTASGYSFRPNSSTCFFASSLAMP